MSDKIPDPPKFRGNKDKFRTFYAQLILKLNGNTDRFPTDESKIAYAIALLEGTAMKAMLPYITIDGRITCESYAKFAEELNRQWGNPYAKQEAAHKITVSQMRKRPLNDLLTEFQRLATEAVIGDDVLVATLDNALSPEFAALILHRDIPNTW